MNRFNLNRTLSSLAVLFGLFAFPALSSAQCSDLFFSEYMEGSMSNKCLEIFNPTSSTITLDGTYALVTFSNGNLSPSSTVNLSGSIAPGDVFVICNPAASFAVAGFADQTSGSVSFNGNDVVSLNNDGIALDIIGQLGNESNFGRDVVQRRNAPITEGDTNGEDAFDFSTEWTAGVNNDPSGLGSHEFDGCDSGSNGASCAELLISEYVEGSGNNKYLEIYNPTANTIDLADYELRRYANGTSTPTSANLGAGGMLASGAVVVFQSSSATAFGGAAINLGNLTHNGDDAYALYNTVTEMNVDIFGVIGDDPGSAWVGNGGFSTANKTLRRNANVLSGVTTNPVGTGNEAFTTLTTEWSLFEQDDVSGLGSHASDCIQVCPTDMEVFINEFHYDNTGSDTGEFVEVAVANSATVDLSNIFLNLYNGNGGGTYNVDPFPLSDFTMGNNDGTYTYYTIDIAGIQNGSPDGFSLNCGENPAFQFLSYEGVIEATSGPADGQTSTDVGVSEPSTASVGSAIQLIDGTWVYTDAQNTKGDTNGSVAVACSISNITVDIDGFCNGDNAEFRVSFDVTGGSGMYEAFDADMTSTVFGDFLFAAPNGNFFIDCTLAGPTSAGTINVNVRDTENNACAASISATVNIPECPNLVCVNPGDLIVTEIMQNPSNVSDTNGEYFEVYNTTGSDIDMLGFVISDADNDSHVINASVMVPANGFVVFGRNAEFAQNGGVVVNYEYADFFLANGADEVIISCSEVVIDQVFYDGGAVFPDPNGASMSLDPDSFNAVANDDGTNWCEASTVFGDGDRGTPGAANEACCAAPEALCVASFEVILDANGAATVSTTDIDNGSTAECGLGSIALSQEAFSCENLGENTVTLTVTDINGGSDACTATVIVTDNSNPTAVCKDVTVFLSPDGTYTLQDEDVLDFANSSDNCGSLSVTSISPATVDCGDFDTTVPVLVSIADASGNADDCTSLVTVAKGNTLPFGWVETAIGGATGEAGFDPCEEVFNVSSTGFPSPSSDKTITASVEVCGDVEIIAELTDLENPGFGGIFIRESFDAGARKVEMKSQLTPFIRRIVRTTQGGNQINRQWFRPNQFWMRLIRSGNVFVGYTSHDGNSWNFVFTVRLNLPDCVQVGLYSESPNINTATTAIFENVSIDTQTAVQLEGAGGTLELGETSISSGDFSVFPNPAQTELSVRLDDYIGNPATLMIYNNLGQIVKQIEMDEVQHTIERIDLNGLDNGMYLLELRSGAERSTKRFVITN